MRFKVRDANWRLRFTPHAERHWGWCDFGKKEIVLSEGMSSRKELETAIHEFEHAFDPDLDESVVKRKAQQLSKLLVRLGYRKEGC